MPNKDMKNFLNKIQDAHLKNFNDNEYTIFEDRILGLRLDHEGTNKDAKEKDHLHRIYIQPVKSSKHVASNGVLARCHAGDKATPAEIIAALKASDKARINGQMPPLHYAPTK